MFRLIDEVIKWMESVENQFHKGQDKRLKEMKGCGLITSLEIFLNAQK